MCMEQYDGRPMPPCPLPEDTNPKDLIGATKPDLSLVTPAGLIYEALAMGVGSVNYGPFNWRNKKIQALVYIAALKRHVDMWVDGEEIDRDLENCGACKAKLTDDSIMCPDHSWKPHLGHAKACLGILIDALEGGTLIDNRPKPGSAARLIRKYTIKRAK